MLSAAVGGRLWRAARTVGGGIAKCEGLSYPACVCDVAEAGLTFRDFALQERYKLLLSLSYWGRQAGGGAAATAYDVTMKAIACGYVEERPIPDGAKYNLWISKRNPPAWVAKGAVRILLGVPEYQPKDEGEQAAFALTLAEAFPEKSLGDLVGISPSGIPVAVLAEAFAARRV